MTIKKEKKRNRRNTMVVETRQRDRNPFIDFSLSSVSTKFAQLSWINFSSFLVVSHHIIQERLLSFYHRPSATTQYGFNTRCLILVFRIWIIDSCHCPPIHERFNIIFAIEDPLGSIQRLPCRNPLSKKSLRFLPLLRGLRYWIQCQVYGA